MGCSWRVRLSTSTTSVVAMERGVEDSAGWNENKLASTTKIKQNFLTILKNTPIFAFMKYLVAGLGNVGAEYELTRHNIGFLVLDRMADNEKVEFTTERLAEKAEIKFKGRQLHLIKPSTYMNLSGKAVAYWLRELKIPKENLIVVVDEIALPFGKMRLKPGGSAGGHNGLKNIELLLSTQDYPRIRVGIGGNYPKGQQVDYVLSRFTDKEFDELPAIMDKVIDAIKSFTTTGIERTMNAYN